MEKKLSEITRKDWIVWQWVECTQMGDEERVFTRDMARTPTEAAQAAEEWDYTAEERGVESKIIRGELS